MQYCLLHSSLKTQRQLARWCRATSGLLLLYSCHMLRHRKHGIRTCASAIRSRLLSRKPCQGGHESLSAMAHLTNCISLWLLVHLFTFDLLPWRFPLATHRGPGPDRDAPASHLSHVSQYNTVCVCVCVCVFLPMVLLILPSCEYEIAYITHVTPHAHPSSSRLKLPHIRTQKIPGTAATISTRLPTRPTV
ncbi:hypothetical protein T440DRAFT_74045 [Plenodomus tracheiphilus IPT5]|uniref:Uncharacterized protein n=1 Tax=Plenodomus tracheiphilus IPT5 TaxID=1408161 RepID=A0A6A7B902_9PLEO|nr:hypothetical protein T440DRAFT_74045 [Plenodomus tracheiphilus IPT5]